MSEAADETADRIRPHLARYRGVVEKKMFGGVGFMLNGNMVVGTTSKGALMVRVDPAKQAEALARPGAFEMHMGPKSMKGFIGAEAEDDESLADWVAYSVAYAKTLPPK